jgi:tetratricopeptide (TPR) repeat protein
LDVTKGKLDSAGSALSSLIASNPNDAELWLYRGWLENARKDYPRVLADFRKVVDAEPAYFKASLSCSVWEASSGAGEGIGAGRQKRR